jgi:hypothetical protein
VGLQLRTISRHDEGEAEKGEEQAIDQGLAEFLKMYWK